MLHLTVKGFMTYSPHTIGQEQSLATAHRVMREHEIRHLPVLHGGELVGVVSQRDLQFLETLAGVDQDQVEVLEAMSSEAYTVEPSASVRTVAAEMADRKLGSAVVVEDGHVIGIFTTIDALRALAALLEAGAVASAGEPRASVAKKRTAKKKTAKKETAKKKAGPKKAARRSGLSKTAGAKRRAKKR